MEQEENPPIRKYIYTDIPEPLRKKTKKIPEALRFRNLFLVCKTTLLKGCQPVPKY